MGLSAGQWSQLEALFADVVDLPRAARAPKLAALEPAIRAELDALLAAADEGGDFLSRPATVVSTEAGTLVAGARLGPWRVLRLAGRGGMGEVYEAERADGQFEQRVAIKLLRHESDAMVERFHAERQILARLEHPGIARLLDGGVTPAGRPYAVMEYVEGSSITQWCRARAAPIEERLRVFFQVCDAVGAAHRAGIVHRDLKPANILVDASGRVRLLDFGIARPLGAGSGELNPFTPEYAAPEQLAGGAITAATDVHALGLILYELLTGERARSGAPRRLRGVLAAIVEKCLRKDPGTRYQSVDVLRVDVERSARRRSFRGPVAAVVACVALAVLAGIAFRGKGADLYATSNPEVFSQYQLGHRFMARESQEGMRRAVESFEKALQLEPRYAPALAGLAVALTVRGRIGWREEGWGEDGRRALQAAEMAVAVAPDLAEAHGARGKTRSWITWDWAGAAIDFERAMRLKPDNGLVQQEYSSLMGSLGRLPEAIAAARRATEVDRLRGHSWHLLATWDGFEGRYAQARAAVERVVELNPDSEIVATTRAQVSLWEGSPQRALEEAATARRPCLWCLAMAHHSLGHAVESQRALDALLKTPVMAAVRIAGVYAWRGERGRAFEWLDRAVAERHPDLVFIKSDPTFRSLHGDPRFTNVLERMSLPVD